METTASSLFIAHDIVIIIIILKVGSLQLSGRGLGLRTAAQTTCCTSYAERASMDAIQKGWFTEVNDLWPGLGTSLQVEKVLHTEKTPYQEMLVFQRSASSLLPLPRMKSAINIV